MPLLLDSRQNGFEKHIRDLIRSRAQGENNIAGTVAHIIDDIRMQGDAALLRLTEQFDHVKHTPASLRVSQEAIETAYQNASESLKTALKIAHQRITGWHQRHIPKDDLFIDGQNIEMRRRWRPIERVGLYVPGGTAAYPSSVLMNAIPAKLAGCARIIMATPSVNGVLNPNILVAAHSADITEIYQIGGAQAISALAIGTETIPKVDKIAGPGNAYVAEAKKQLFGEVGIDSIAGPSEILIIADENNHPQWCAADLLAQAEHDENAQAILITPSPIFAENVRLEVEKQLPKLERHAIARRAWENYGAIIRIEKPEDAIDIANLIAPEHLHIIVDKNVEEELIRHIHHAGAIFIGHYTPEALGDYIAGPNHVLPTNGSARYSSGLAVEDFMKRTSILRANRDALKNLAPHAIKLAETENLQAHAHSLRIREQKNSDSK